MAINLTTRISFVHTLAIGLLICIAVILTAPYVQASNSPSFLALSTSDGLTIDLSGKTEVIIEGKSLKALVSPGGLMVRDASRKRKGMPNILTDAGFEEGHYFDDKNNKGRKDTIIYHSGHASALLKGAGGAKPKGSGEIMFVGPVMVKGEREYAFSCFVRGMNIMHYDQTGEGWFSFRVFIVQTDLNGKRTANDIEVGFPGRGQKDFGWTQMRRIFKTASRTRRVKLCWEIFNGSGSLWVDDVEFTEAGTSLPIIVGGKIQGTPQGASQKASLEEMGLQVLAEYRSLNDRIEVIAEVADTTGKDRAVQIGFRLPVDLSGWHWEEHLNISRRISGANEYHNWYELGPGRYCNIFPLSAVSGKSFGIGMAVPMEVPRVYRISYGPEGMEIWFDLGLSEITRHMPGRANVQFVLFKYPSKWGFRAAIQKYYEMYPEYFIRRTNQVGNCNLGHWYDNLRNPEDFALRFGGNTPIWNKRNGTYTFTYTEPWGWWMPWQRISRGERPPRPSYEEAIKRLHEYSRADPNTLDWSYMTKGIPLATMAKAVLNSGIVDSAGRLYYFGGGRWNTWGGDIIHQYWMANPDPSIEKPTRTSIAYDYELSPRWRIYKQLGLKTEGPSFDSVGNFGLEDYNREHWKGIKTPLTFNPFTREPCQLDSFASYDYLSQVTEEMRKQDRLVMANTFPYAQAYYGHLLDMFLSEGTIDQIRHYKNQYQDGCSYLRIMARTKNISFYDYDWYRTSDATREHRVQKHLFYGTFPGLPWMQVENEKWQERIRPICRRYFPVIERLAKAGWHPITGATSTNPKVMVERYGSGAEGNLCLTLRAKDHQSCNTTLRIDPKEVGLAIAPGQDIFVLDLLRSKVVAAKTTEKAISIYVDLARNETAAFAIGEADNVADWYIKRAETLIDMIKDVGVFNTKVVPLENGIDLRPLGYVDHINSVGSYKIVSNSEHLDYRGRPAVLLYNERADDVGIYFVAGCVNPSSTRDFGGPGRKDPDSLKNQAGATAKQKGFDLVVDYYVEHVNNHRPDSTRVDITIFTVHPQFFNMVQTVVPLDITSEGGGTFKKRVIMPAGMGYWFISCGVKGSEVKLWLKDQVLVPADKMSAALKELKTGKDIDSSWLATVALKTLGDIKHQISQSQGDLDKIIAAHQTLRRFTEELSERYPASEELRNKEVWQRLNDATTNLETAMQIMSR